MQDLLRSGNIYHYFSYSDHISIPFQLLLHTISDVVRAPQFFIKEDGEKSYTGTIEQWARGEDLSYICDVNINDVMVRQGVDRLTGNECIWVFLRGLLDALAEEGVAGDKMADAIQKIKNGVGLMVVGWLGIGRDLTQI